MNPDPELLTGISDAELEALADAKLAPSAQARLDELLAGDRQDQLTPADRTALDRLLAKVDQLTILKTRARYTLGQRTGARGT
jgi:hypothetical protein